MDPSALQDGVINILGPGFIGMLLSTLFTGFIIVQAYDYYSLYSDVMSLKLLVGVSVALTIGKTATNIATIWNVSILNFASFERLSLLTLRVPVTFLIHQFISPLTQVSVQSFFVWRCWNLSRNSMFTIMVALLMLLSFGSGTAIGVLLTVRYTRIVEVIQNFAVFKLATDLSACSSAATDGVLTCYFCYKMVHLRSEFNSTQNVIRKLMRLNVETTLSTSALAIAGACALRFKGREPWSILFTLLLNRSYVINLLAVLNMRQKLRLELDNSSAEPTSGRGTNNSSNLPLWSFHTKKRDKVNQTPTRIEVQLDTMVYHEHESSSNVTSKSMERNRTLDTSNEAGYR